MIGDNYLLRGTKMDIFRAERIAQDRMAGGDHWDKSFKLVGPKGEIECEWLDPYFGLFQIKGQDGFVSTKQIPSTVEVVMEETPEEALSRLGLVLSKD